MVELKNLMIGNTKGIDEQVDSIRSARIQYNRCTSKMIVDTVILALAGRQNVLLRGHLDDSQHYSSSNPGNFQAFLNYRADGGDTKIQQHFVTAKNATYRKVYFEVKLL